MSDILMYTEYTDYTFHHRVSEHTEQPVKSNLQLHEQIIIWKNQLQPHVSKAKVKHKTVFEKMYT